MLLNKMVDLLKKNSESKYEPNSTKKHIFKYNLPVVHNWSTGDPEF